MNNLIAVSSNKERRRKMLNKAAKKTKLKLKEIRFLISFLRLKLDIKKRKSINITLKEYTDKAINNST